MKISTISKEESQNELIERILNNLNCTNCTNCTNCEELNALKLDYKACEEEYKRLAGQYRTLLKQNEELQATINRTCKDCNSDARLQEAINEFEIVVTQNQTPQLAR